MLELGEEHTEKDPGYDIQSIDCDGQCPIKFERE